MVSNENGRRTFRTEFEKKASSGVKRTLCEFHPQALTPFLSPRASHSSTPVVRNLQEETGAVSKRRDDAPASLPSHHTAHHTAYHTAYHTAPTLNYVINIITLFGLRRKKWRNAEHILIRNGVINRAGWDYRKIRRLGTFILKLV